MNLSDLEREIVEFSLGLGPREAAGVQQGRAWIAPELEGLQNTWLLILYSAEKGHFRGCPSSIPLLCLMVAESLDRIRACLADGYPGPAIAHLRKVFEDSLTLQIILKSPDASGPEAESSGAEVERRARWRRDGEARAQLFEDYLRVEKWLSLKRARERLRQKQITEEQFQTAFPTHEYVAKVETDYEGVRSNYHEFMPYSWCWKLIPSEKAREYGQGASKKKVYRNPSVKDQALFVGGLFEHFYEMVYHFFSVAVHSSPGYATMFMQVSKGKGVTALPKFREFGATAGLLGYALALDAYSTAIDFANPENRRLLRAMSGEVLQTAKRRIEARAPR
jgi:Family of unknown function (DUF5677)